MRTITFYIKRCNFIFTYFIIIIRFQWSPSKHGGYRRVEKFIFIDNGYGMDENRLYDYFIATEGDKRSKKEGIGKFGVGAYMSGISQAAKCEVYSKTSGGKWLYTILEKGKKIPKPIPKDPPKKYEIGILLKKVKV